MDRTTVDPIADARAAIDRGDWPVALAAARRADADGALDAEGLQVLAEASYGAGHLEAAIEAFERQHTRCLADGDRLGAAAAATSVAMYLMMDTGLMAPVRGWAARAEQLLDGLEEHPVHAWLAMVRTYERFMSGDLAAAAEHAAEAIAVGARQRAPEPAAIARIGAARVQILTGEVAAGMALLDEAAVVVMSGELDPLPTGMAWCELICAMQGLAQYDRADEWTQAMEQWRHGHAIGGISGRCRVHRAEILRLRGSCGEAEEEALRACEELRPFMRREFGWPLTELGTIRLRRGDLAGAEEAFLAAHAHVWDPHPGLALVRLAQGHVASAQEEIRTALDHPAAIPSKERPPVGTLRRAPLLDAQVAIAVAAGAVDTARAAATELTAIADQWPSRALHASAVIARGRVALACGEVDDAIAALADGVVMWGAVGAPYETAQARLVLAAAHRAAGHADRARLEEAAARHVLDELGVRSSPRPAAAPPASPAPRGTPAAGVFRREGDIWCVGFGDDTVLLHDLKGLRYLARLLAEPGREFHALDLVAVEAGGAPPERRGDGLGPLLDEQAKQAYRRRLVEIEDDIEEARRHGDDEREALAEADREFLLRELARAVGLGGRDRPVGASTERARTSVTRSIRYALARVREHHVAVADHLDHAVRTGTYCAYEPDPHAPTRWRQ